MIYLDHAATTFPHPMVSDFLKNQSPWGVYSFNPHSKNSSSENVWSEIQKCKSNFFKYFHWPLGELTMTASATLSNNLFVKLAPLEKTVWYFSGDHPSLVKSLEARAKLGHFTLKSLPLKKISKSNEWTIAVDWNAFLKGIMDDGPESLGGLCLSTVNNSSGLILYNQHTEKIIRELRKLGAKFVVHLDMSQSFLKDPMNEYDFSLIDSCVISSHKCGGPRNFSLLYTQSALTKKMLNEGEFIHGGHQQVLYSGTLDGVTAMAFFNFYQHGEKEFALQRHSIMLWREKLRKFSNAINAQYQKSHNANLFLCSFDDEDSSPYIFTFIFLGLPSDMLLRLLEKEKILISSTSACNAKKGKIDQTFTNLLIPAVYHPHVLRVSFGLNTVEDDIDQFILAFERIIKSEKFLIDQQIGRNFGKNTHHRL